MQAGSCAVLCLLCACTVYKPLSLPIQSGLAPDISALIIDMPADAGGSHHHAIDTRNGLDLVEVSLLAVLNNPDLRARRASLGVAEAQSFAAGLLPDPRLSAGLEKPTSHIPGETLVDAYSLGLGYELQSLLTRHSRVGAAKQDAQRVRLELLWQEWQTAQQAQLLAVRSVLEGRQLRLLDDAAHLAHRRSKASAAALHDGDVTLADHSIDRIAWLDAETGRAELRRGHADTLANLDLLLGLRPGAAVPVDMAADSELPRMDAGDAERAIAALPTRRPDLLALQAGYQSQEEQLRGAILAQFPALNVDAGGARDTGDISTRTFSIGLSLPLFDRNRGAIAVATATRAQLRQEYAARLAQTEFEVRVALRQQAQLRRQQTALSTTLPSIEDLRNHARAALLRGDIDARGAQEIESAWLAKQLEGLAVTQGLWENALLLETLLATPVTQLGISGDSDSL